MDKNTLVHLMPHFIPPFLEASTAITAFFSHQTENSQRSGDPREKPTGISPRLRSNYICYSAHKSVFLQLG